ncbi:MAG: M12 family metallo-peptidase [Pseudomonadales bacterium]|nr:M12 family metallo-peptidase [Pseudomonadales bacterium]
MRTKLILTCLILALLSVRGGLMASQVHADVDVGAGAGAGAGGAGAFPVLLQQVEADANWPVLPEASIEARAVLLDAEVLAALNVGERFSIRLGTSAETAEELVAIISSESSYINGDRTLTAHLEGLGVRYPLIITAGTEAVFAQLNGEQDSWQLLLNRVPGSTFLQGWLYQTLIPVRNWKQDYVIPRAPEFSPQSLPLQLQNESAKTDPVGQKEVFAASTAGINSNNFEVQQFFSKRSLIAGETVTVELRVRNTSQENHKNLELDIHFALDNTELLAMSQACRRLSIAAQGRDILNCRLGDFSPGASKTFSYSVRSTNSSKPWIASTAIIGALRDDVWLRVVDDVQIDADADGVSDFNEQLLGTDPLLSQSVVDDVTVIDLMALFTPASRALHGAQLETKINQLVSVANHIYRESGVRIRLRPVFHGQVDFPQTEDMDTALEALTFKTHPAFAKVNELRARFGADLVVLFRPQGNEPDRCGLANLGGRDSLGDFSSSNEKDYAYSIVAIDCPVTAALAHELGHSMGLTHSRREDGSGGTLPWATGYGLDSRFVTVMAFPGVFNTDIRLPLFSSPALDCLGDPCGIDRTDTEAGADAVQVMNLVRHQIAAYFPARLPDPVQRTTGRLSGLDTDAQIAIAASVDNGLSFVDRVHPGQVLDITAALKIDSADVGKPGYIYVLAITAGGNLLQLTATGELLPWDNDLAALHPFAGKGILAPVESVTAIKGLLVDTGLVGERLSLFVAYRVADNMDLIYTEQPLQLSIDPAP